MVLKDLFSLLIVQYLYGNSEIDILQKYTSVENCLQAGVQLAWLLTL